MIDSKGRAYSVRRMNEGASFDVLKAEGEEDEEVVVMEVSAAVEG